MMDMTNVKHPHMEELSWGLRDLSCPSCPLDKIKKYINTI